MANILIMGAGNQTHALLKILTCKGHCVSFLTRKADDINAKLSSSDIEVKDAQLGCSEYFSSILVTASPEDIVPEADIILITNPANDQERVLTQIQDYLPKNRPILIGAIPA